MFFEDAFGTHWGRIEDASEIHCGLLGDALRERWILYSLGTHWEYIRMHLGCIRNTILKLLVDWKTLYHQ